jgi:hypothetical protein
VPIEVANGFRAPRRFELAQRLGLAVGEALGRGPLVTLAPIGALAGGAQIDQVSHFGLVGTGCDVINSAYGAKCAAMMSRRDNGRFGGFRMSPQVNLRPALWPRQYTVG